jgi:hemerythrin-like domain-containing protein
MIIPDPATYQDGVAYFRDMHKLILHNCAELDLLLNDAEREGVFQSFAAKKEWDELLAFFVRVAPLHERDEEEFLFPALVAKIPRVGFQQPDAPIRFLIEGHEVLQQKTEVVVKDWFAFRNTPRDPATLAESHAKHAAEDAAFIANGRELVRLYRDHIAKEEERVYSIADKVLSFRERQQLIQNLREAYDNEAVTPPMLFDMPQFSNPAYNIHYTNTDARAGESLDAEFEDEDE